MSDRYKGLSVTLKPDTREEEGAAIIAAIKMIRGVLAVVPSVETGEDIFIRTQVAYEWHEKIYALLKANP